MCVVLKNRHTKGENKHHSENELDLNLPMLVRGGPPVEHCTVQQLQVHTVKNTGGEFKGGVRVVCATQSPTNE